LTKGSTSGWRTYAWSGWGENVVVEGDAGAEKRLILKLMFGTETAGWRACCYAVVIVKRGHVWKHNRK